MQPDKVESPAAQVHGGQGGADEAHTALGVYHVNQEKARVAAHDGEELPGREILRRAGFSYEKYELFTVEHGKTGREIKPDEVHQVKPGDHYRATIRGTDYSCPTWEHSARRQRSAA
jgi:hypothetical protein